MLPGASVLPVMRRDLTDAEIRVLGCLVEKQRTTPDAYPLTLNSLRLACNQATNRDPVTEYDEATVREALGALGRRRFIRSASAHGSRSAKYRHLLAEELPLPDGELSVLTVLMLRGSQTPGELKQRTDRMHPFASVSEVGEALEALIGRDLVQRIPRRPGQKEDRFSQLLGRDRLDAEATEGDPAAGPEPASPPSDSPPDRLATLIEAVEALTERVERIESRLDHDG